MVERMTCSRSCVPGVSSSSRTSVPPKLIWRPSPARTSDVGQGDRQAADEWVGEVDQLEVAEVLADDAARVGDEVVHRVAVAGVLLVRRLVQVDGVHAEGAHAEIEQSTARLGAEERVLEVGRRAVM